MKCSKIPFWAIALIAATIHAICIALLVGLTDRDPQGVSIMEGLCGHAVDNAGVRLLDTFTILGARWARSAPSLWALTGIANEVLWGIAVAILVCVARMAWSRQDKMNSG